MIPFIRGLFLWNISKMDNEVKKMYREILKSMYMICDCDICIKIKKQPTEKIIIKKSDAEKLESKEVKEQEFKIGDVVVLKSGGCDMTIDELHENNVVTCIYMNYMSKVEKITINKNALKKS